MPLPIAATDVKDEAVLDFDTTVTPLDPVAKFSNPEKGDPPLTDAAANPYKIMTVK